MKKFLFISLLCPILLVANEGKSPRFLVHILDYLAIDYGGAVQNGKVIEKNEYAEQIEFVNETLRLTTELSELKHDKVLFTKLETLKSLVVEKKDEKVVSTLAKEVKNYIVAKQAIELFPRRWGNRRTKSIYGSSCQFRYCHCFFNRCYSNECTSSDSPTFCCLFIYDGPFIFDTGRKSSSFVSRNWTDRNDSSAF